MDPLAALLQGPRAQSAFVLRSSLDPPWCLRIEDGAPLTIAAVVRGSAWVKSDDGVGHPVLLESGDVLVSRGPTPYAISDAIEREPTVIIGPGQQCTILDNAMTYEDLPWSARSWGNSTEGSTLLVTGTYTTGAQVSQRVLAALPPISVVGREHEGAAALALLADEVVKDRPGQSTILDRLLDVVCVGAIRACLTRIESVASGWYRAFDDPVVGKALELIHERPAAPWTVATLASEVCVSRAAFARRFRELVGEAPVAYLTRWRLDLAADELQDPARKIAAVAEAVGYESQFAFSHAFKRQFGCSPSEYRQA